jgi:hypothetical protein
MGKRGKVKGKYRDPRIFTKLNETELSCSFVLLRDRALSPFTHCPFYPFPFLLSSFRFTTRRQVVADKSG